MEIKTYKFQETNFDQKSDPVLLAEAKKRGFHFGNTYYNTLFSKLFFNGGSLNFKKDLDDDFKNRAVSYFKALVQSFSPSHEDKEAVCALLLSELVEEKTND